MAKSRNNKSKPVPTPPRPKSPRAGSGRALIFLLLATAFITCLVLIFLVIDRRTTAALQNRSFSKLPALYSDSRTIEVGKRIRPELLSAELARRRYREVTGKPRVPGEFSANGREFQIFTRDFTTGPGGISSPAVLATYNPETGDVTVEGSAQQSFALEPQPFSDLVGGDTRTTTFTKLADIPKSLIDAVVSVEDERFYHHFGIDPIGIARAMFTNIKSLSWVQGGSTITQQLAKNLVLSPKRDLSRKFLEVFSALSLERQLTKEEILELYLNEVYLGQEGPVAVHGVAEAAQGFFGKKLSELSLGEQALMAGIIRAPSYNSPRKHPQRAIERRNTALEKMLELGTISKSDFTKARSEKLHVIQEGQHMRIAPHYTAALRQILDRDHDLDVSIASGLNVYTGFDVEMQRCAEHAVSEGAQLLERRNPVLRRRGAKIEAGLVAIEPYSGKVRAWAGGTNYSVNQFDHVYQARRQIGSTIKPFVYLTALDPNLNRYKPATPMSILVDEPLSIDLPTHQRWSPENYDRQFRGDVTLRYAVENSLNLPAVYLAQRVGMDAIAATVRAFHVSEHALAVPSLALGAADTSLLDLTAAYAGIANGGVYIRPRIFLSAVNHDGETLASTPIEEQRLADEGAVYVLTNILQGVVERGTASKVRALGFTDECAGKTGTSDEARDAWFVGFTPDLVAGVWVGFDDNAKLGLTGGGAAVPIWTEFMKCAADFHDHLSFIAPPGVVFVNIDKRSHQRATPECPEEDIMREVFVKGTEPVTYCRFHGGSIAAEADSGIRDLPREPERRRRSKSIWDLLFGR